MFVPAGGDVQQEAGESGAADWRPGRGEDSLERDGLQPRRALQEPDRKHPYLSCHRGLPGGLHLQL